MTRVVVTPKGEWRRRHRRLEAAPGGAPERHPLAQAFHRLTPDTILDAVEAGGRRCTGRFIILNSYENRVYQLELDDHTMVVGKFYRPGRWSREAILDEHRFLFELEEAEIPVATPLYLDGERTVGRVQGIFYSLFPRIGGRVPQELTDEQVDVLGRLVARIHNVGATGDAPNRPPLVPETFADDNLKYLLRSDLIPAEVRDIYRATIEALLLRIRPMFEGLPLHRIHGDCHPNNLIWAPQGPTFLDFDDLRVGPAVQDIWMLVPSYDADGQRQRERLLEAYGQFRDFEHHWLRLVEPLRALRYIHYTAWIARRWADPIFPRTFPQFGTVNYWQREVMDLREQLARIDLDTTGA